MSKTTTRKKHWSKNLEESGVKLRIYERAASGSVWCSPHTKEADGRKNATGAREGPERGRQAASEP